MARRSKVDKLPPELKAQLERLLADRSHDGYAALAAWLSEQGYTISKSSLHRYDEGRVQKVMEKVRATMEAARLMTAASPDEADEHSAAVIRMVQSQLFAAMMQVTEAEGEIDPETRMKLLTQAARAIAEASRASIGQKKWADEVRARLDAIEQQAEKTGKRLDAETLMRIREGLYGG
ncbi:DUF3486 family protein [Pelomicrobium methylotrophicum]|uniref:DUF3486 family protein n=1 Tax=Pelomicrobium methylotrophicum TaxID=2602750 RepID=A0A5C7ETC2_9PROT|nr:phage protein Gp27 family protein [Pelomicrobium methylotrophicum]TXF11915.1 DUF3486 family protein [Pelomicrobium methylotrophicum]